MKKEYPRVPFPLIVKACDGDTEAINQILKHYRGFIVYDTQIIPPRRSSQSHLIGR